MNEQLIDDALEKHRPRKLPHWKRGGATYFITFRSIRGALSTECLQVVKNTIDFEDEKRIHLWGGCVMPDHEHLIVHPYEVQPGLWHDPSAILKSIKGISSRRINLLLGTSGQVWQKESYDHLIRDEDEFHQTRHYVWCNPIRAGFVEQVEDWPFQLGLNHVWE